uniref:DUF6090 family protein n=1 Tax=uncultured Polaribacter sp. TaxID=174711 RepID=UPI00261DA604|nr:DUF6090 family protein [uncultured Polaribacter sp.]
MIKFFRKIRQRLLAENRFNKYLLYAVGEIVLVVIGILIALQINNNNEAKNNKERFIKVLKEIRKDLETDLSKTEFLLERGREMDSLTRHVLSEKITKEQYLKKENRDLFWVGLQFTAFDYQKTAFQKFENFNGIIPQEFDSLTNKISNYYNLVVKRYDYMYERLRQQIKDRHDYLATNHNWYYLLRKKETTEEMINFYVNNPVYKNWVSQHSVDNTTGKYGDLKKIENDAFLLLLEINSYLKDNYKINDTYLLNKYGYSSETSDLVGDYKDINDNLTFKLHKKGGFLFFHNDDILKYKNDTLSFLKYTDMIMVVKRNTDNKVEGLKYIDFKDATRNSYAKKLKND